MSHLFSLSPNTCQLHVAPCGLKVLDDQLKYCFFSKTRGTITIAPFLRPALANLYLYAAEDTKTGTNHHIPEKDGLECKPCDVKISGLSSEIAEPTSDEATVKTTRKEKSVLQSKLTRLAIQIGYAGEIV